MSSQKCDCVKSESQQCILMASLNKTKLNTLLKLHCCVSEIRNLFSFNLLDKFNLNRFALHLDYV